MDRITDSTKPSKTYQCRKCGAHWRIYNADAKPDLESSHHFTRFYVKCEECGQRAEVTFVLSFAMKHEIELEAIRKKREEENERRHEVDGS